MRFLAVVLLVLVVSAKAFEDEPQDSMDNDVDLERRGFWGCGVYNVFTKGCCDGEKYVRKTHDCCGEEVIKESTHGCCHGKKYSKKRQKCCDGKVKGAFFTKKC